MFDSLPHGAAVRLARVLLSLRSHLRIAVLPTRILLACACAAIGLAVPASANASTTAVTAVALPGGGAQFALAQTPVGAAPGFDCAFDAGAFAACAGADVVTGLGTYTVPGPLCDGGHTLVARAGSDGDPSSPAVVTTVGGVGPCISAATLPAGAVSAAGATLAGQATLAGAPAGARFEVTAPGRQTITTPSQPVAASRPVEAAVAGLAPSTTYSYRLVVTDVDGTDTVAPSVTFATPAASAPAPIATTAPDGNGPIVTTVIDRGVGTARLLAALRPELLAFADTIDGRSPAALARRRAFSPRFTWLVPGKIEVVITAPSSAARKASGRLREAAPITVARGVAQRTSAGQAVVPTRLTSTGRALLRRIRRVRLTITTIFTPWGGSPVAGRRMAALRRPAG